MAHRDTDVLGQDATTWSRAVTDNDKPLLLRADDVRVYAIAGLGAVVVDVIGDE